MHIRNVEQLQGALINGLEARVSVIEDKLEDLDARTSEEADNALNERELDRFIMSGEYFNAIMCIALLLLIKFVSVYFDPINLVFCEPFHSGPIQRGH